MGAEHPYVMTACLSSQNHTLPCPQRRVMYSMYSVFHAVAHGCLGVQLQVRQYSIIKGYLLDFGFFFLWKKCSQRRVSVRMDVNATVGLSHAALRECRPKYEEAELVLGDCTRLSTRGLDMKLMEAISGQNLKRKRSAE